MKGRLTLAILEAVGNGLADSALLLEAFLIAGYGASQGKIKREISRLERERGKKRETRQVETQQLQRYYNTISRLKRDNLLVQEANGRFRITAFGLRKRDKLKKQKTHYFPVGSYPVQKSENVVIIAFDVPEQERRKRDWLRSTLKNLGLKMVQQSVWIGKIKIPKDFLDDIKELRLIDCVEIFEVSKTGTLEHLV